MPLVFNCVESFDLRLQKYNFFQYAKLFCENFSIFFKKNIFRGPYSP